MERELWSIHDRHKTARANISTPTEEHIAKIILGRKLFGAWQVYDPHNYLPDQAKAFGNRI
ncbi:hypothetical protein A6B37_11385 [Achromobacter sp. HZ01]|nr:hypothetical protein A6B37_11385 [Achromobacter sp. HZ01]